MWYWYNLKSCSFQIIQSSRYSKFWVWKLIYFMFLLKTYEGDVIRKELTRQFWWVPQYMFHKEINNILQFLLPKFSYSLSSDFVDLWIFWVLIFLISRFFFFVQTTFADICVKVIRFLLSTVELQLHEPWRLTYLPDKNSFLGPYGPIYETSVVRFWIYVFMLLFWIFFF